MKKLNAFKLLLVFLCTLVVNKTEAQRSFSGVFFLRENVKGCQYSIRNSEKSYCTGAHPIVTLDEFESISEVYKGEKASFFEISLSRSGQLKFKNIFKAKMDLELGLVINGILIGIIDRQEGIVYDKFRVFSYSNREGLNKARNGLLVILNKDSFGKREK